MVRTGGANIYPPFHQRLSFEQCSAPIGLAFPLFCRLVPESPQSEPSSEKISSHWDPRWALPYGTPHRAASLRGDGFHLFLRSWV